MCASIGIDGVCARVFGANRMDRRSRERLRSLEEALGAQIADLRADVSDKDLERVAKAGR